LYDRNLTKQSKRISNPGCYATNNQLLLAPLMPHLDLAQGPSVFGISGYSGAGTKSGQKDADGRSVTLPKVVSLPQPQRHTVSLIQQTPEDLAGGIRPYALTDHIHERESSTHLRALLSTPNPDWTLSFIPSVAPWFSGIISVLNAPLAKVMRASEVHDLYEAQYANERLISVGKKVPEIKDGEGRHGWRMGGVQVHSGGKRAVVVGVLDNLLKGAATQCMQVRTVASVTATS
jgi:N-acetyl-gamma-glutamyl-phosphate reductase/acetylglutamate kinase